MAPITSLHLIPSIESNASATILARCFKEFRTSFFSYETKKYMDLVEMLVF